MKKRKTAWVILLLVFICLCSFLLVRVALTANNITEEPVETGKKNQYGNTLGNLANAGMVAFEEEWVYFSDYFEGKYGLNKMKENGSERRILVKNEYPRYINVLSDWIYYVNSNNKLYKIKTDGSKRKCILTEVTKICLIENSFYYINSKDQKLYKVMKDGSKRALIVEDKIKSFNVVDDWIYYINSLDGERIYKIRTDGSNKTKINNEKTSSLIIIKDWIYYINWAQGGLLNRMKFDGSNNESFNLRGFSCFNIFEEWVLFNQHGLSRIRIDSFNTIDGKRILSEVPSINGIYVTENWIYYTSNIRKGNSKGLTTELYRIKIDGSINEKLSM